MSIPKKAISVCYGWVNPVTKEKKRYKILIATHYVDAELNLPFPPSGEVSPEELEEYGAQISKFLDFTSFRRELINGKVRFYCHGEEELNRLKRILDEKKVIYTVNEITLTDRQKQVISDLESLVPFLTVDAVRRKLSE